MNTKDEESDHEQGDERGIRLITRRRRDDLDPTDRKDVPDRETRAGGGETNRTPQTAKTSRTANAWRWERDEQDPADRKDEPDRKH